MGNPYGVTELGATALSSGLSFLGNLGGSIASSYYNAKQAKLNREFQERMYDKQVQDNINFWKMQQDYNLPSAQLQRIRDAHLNPLLLYGEGGISGNIASQAPDSGTAPHGAQAQSSFNTALNFENLAMLKAQVENIQANTAKTEAETNESRNRNISIVLQNEITERTKEAVIAMKDRDIQKIDQEIEWLATQDYCLTNMTAANIDNISSIMDFRKKYYELDNTRLANDAWYQIQSIAIGKQHVSNELKQIAVDMYRAETDRKRVVGELAVFAAQVESINANTDLTQQEKSNKILEGYNQFLKNTMMENIGTDNLGGAAGLLLLLTGTMSGRIQ